MTELVMNKSQLRKLAREFSLGKLDEETYRQRRRTLVEDIVSGRVAIVREAPLPPQAAYSEDPTTKLSIGAGAEDRRFSPVAIVLGIVVIAALAWVLIPWVSEDTGRIPDDTIERSASIPAAARARLLIEDFVAEKDFSEFSIASFKESWSHLSRADKQDAFASHWFNDLTNLLSDEIKTQNALASSGDARQAVETGERLEAFADFLGVSDNVTEFKGVPQAPAAPDAAPAPSDSPAGVKTTARSEPPAPEPGGLSPLSSEPLPTPVSSRKTVRVVSDTDWLDRQPENGYTLQLFAVNQLDEIQSLAADNPGVDLNVLASAHSEPRYRVVHGTFDSELAARNAHAALPAGIRRAQPDPLVRSMEGLRREVERNDWVTRLGAGQFTLQVMATGDADSARRLMASYPALDLNLLDTRDAVSRYRVLYGAYGSEASARTAAARLPAELLEITGDPLVKQAEELKAVKR